MRYVKVAMSFRSCIRYMFHFTLKRHELKQLICFLLTGKWKKESGSELGIPLLTLLIKVLARTYLATVSTRLKEALVGIA